MLPTEVEGQQVADQTGVIGDTGPGGRGDGQGIEKDIVVDGDQAEAGGMAVVARLTGAVNSERAERVGPARAEGGGGRRRRRRRRG